MTAMTPATTPVPAPAPGAAASPADDPLAGALAAIVDRLMPRLTPSETAAYLYLFRHSILKTGRPYARASLEAVRAAAASAYAGIPRGPSRAPAGRALSLDTARSALAGLAAIGAVRREGAPTRQGALYRVFLPAEIAACAATEAAPAGTAPAETAAGAAEAGGGLGDGSRRGIEAILARDGYECQRCGAPVDEANARRARFEPAAGDAPDNLIAVCPACCDDA
jgi:hypothetical protein